ncbi:PEP-CTERM sorting domain-containing protein [Virgifigura deserti]|uniref:PEP-CTERM sorting domain-containing protein n=1 Tax=Virgifigura deserti TaxID=2268457 RepID=UPI003CCC0433
MRLFAILAVGVLAAAPSLALAAPIQFTAPMVNINPESQTGVPNPASGTVDLTLDLDNRTLTTHFQLSGLEIGQDHPRHIHGNVDANLQPLESTIPTLAQDVDNDNFIEFLEGAQTYGPVILDLGAFRAEADGTYDAVEVFDLHDSSLYGTVDPLDPTSQQFDITALLGDSLDPSALELRHLVVHGLTLPEGAGVPNPDFPINEADGTAGYKAVLPVLNGDIVQVTEVPEPGTMAMLGAGLFGLGFIARRRGKTA